MSAEYQNAVGANSSAVQPAKVFPARAALVWQIRASQLQSGPPQLTCSRRPPLPSSLDAYVCGYEFRATYRGHGQSKVAYLLEAMPPNDGHPLGGKVLKLCKGEDPEPTLFRMHMISGVYPPILEAAPVFEVDSVARPVCGWNGWITDLAVPLDEALRRPQLSLEAAGRLIVGAARCMLGAVAHGHTMDDPSLCNFGVIEGRVVIIDAGRRPLNTELSKSDFNKGVMKKFWPRAAVSIADGDLQKYKVAWQNARSMDDARHKFDDLWRSGAGRPAPASFAARPRATAPIDVALASNYAHFAPPVPPAALAGMQRGEPASSDPTTKHDTDVADHVSSALADCSDQSSAGQRSEAADFSEAASAASDDAHLVCLAPAPAAQSVDPTAKHDSDV